MSINTLNKRALVLNKGWQAVNTINIKDAISKIYSGTAKALGKDFIAYEFDAWVQTWSDISIINKLDKEKYIFCEKYKILAPEVIILNDYNHLIRREARFSRKNIFLRDGYTCQYCGQKLPPKKLNIDHIIPSSRGGATTWENVILSCISCNTKKAARTPKEAGMKLLKKPTKPKWSALQSQLGTKLPDSWKSFVDSYYWNVSLSDEK